MTSFKKAVQKANRFLAESGSKTMDSAKNRFYSLTFSTELKDSMRKLIIFDFDGTIADTTELIVNTMQATLKELGLPLYSREECASKIGLPLREMFVSLMDESVADKCEATYRKIYAATDTRGLVKPYPKVVDTIRLLRETGVKLTIATSRSRRTLISFLEDMDIIQYFSYIVAVDDVSKGKPDPEPVLLTLKNLGMQATDALVVGDTPYDVLMGKGAGTSTCAVTYGNGTIEEFRTVSPDYIIDDFSEIITL